MSTRMSRSSSGSPGAPVEGRATMCSRASSRWRASSTRSSPYGSPACAVLATAPASSSSRDASDSSSDDQRDSTRDTSAATAVPPRLHLGQSAGELRQELLGALVEPGGGRAGIGRDGRRDGLELVLQRIALRRPCGRDSRDLGADDALAMLHRLDPRGELLQARLHGLVRPRVLDGRGEQVELIAHPGALLGEGATDALDLGSRARMGAL